MTDGPDGRQAKVSVKGLNFYYRDVHALKDITMDFPDRCVTALIGPSGCGKSTLLRVFNRMYDLYPGQRAEGQVMVDGENIIGPGIELSMLRAKIGMVFQRPTPFPMSIYENIAFPVRLYRKVPRREMNDLVEKTLSKAALWNEVKDMLHRSGLSLSGGQQQRLCRLCHHRDLLRVGSNVERDLAPGDNANRGAGNNQQSLWGGVYSAGQYG